MSTKPNSTNTNEKSREDVLAFLNDLDSFPRKTPSTIPGSSTQAAQSLDQLFKNSEKPKTNQDVLNFLDELDPSLSKKERLSSSGSNIPAKNRVESNENKNTNKPSTSNLTSSVSPAAPQLQSTSGEIDNTNTSTEIEKTDRSDAVTVQTASSKGGFFSGLTSTIWKQAEVATTNIKSSSLVKQGFESAQRLADQSTKIVAQSVDMGNEKVKGLVTEGRKIGFDISKLTHSIVDTIAPPIDGTQKDTITIWMCIENTDDEDIDSLHDLVQSVVNETWIRRFGGICEKVVVHSVKDPAPVLSKGFKEALQQTHLVSLRMSKLAESIKESPEELKNDLYFVIQPMEEELDCYENVLGLKTKTVVFKKYLSFFSGFNLGVLQFSQSLTRLNKERCLESLICDSLDEVFNRLKLEKENLKRMSLELEKEEVEKKNAMIDAEKNNSVTL